MSHRIDASLLIRVVALSGRVPVEAFLRAARELATTAVCASGELRVADQTGHHAEGLCDTFRR